jgi:hypothetical protein
MDNSGALTALYKGVWKSANAPGRMVIKYLLYKNSNSS